MPDPHKASVLWTKGQNFFAAFFVEIGNIRKEIDNDTEFSRWCFDELHIPLGAITRVSDVLTKVDAEKVRQELASAKAAENAQKARERAAQRAAAEAERQRQQEAKAAAAAEKARRAELEKQQRKAEKKKASKRKNNAGWKLKEREARAKALNDYAQLNGRAVASADARSEADLVRQIKDGQELMAFGRDQWIDGAIMAAGALCEARARYPANQKFHLWLEEHEIDIDINDRAAMLQLGVSPKAMRELLRQSNRSSLRHIWNDEVKPRLTAA
jgi:hypothetical protein